MLSKNTSASKHTYWAALTALPLTFCVLTSLDGCSVGGSGTPSLVTTSTTSVTNNLPSTINITSGGTYSGIWVSNDPSIPAVQVSTDESVIIQNSVVSGRGHLIVINGVSGANVTVRNVTGTGLDPQVTGAQRGSFLRAFSVNSLVVQNCTMTGTSFGVLVYTSTASTLKIMNNTAAQLDDRASDGKGGFLASRPTLGHFIQIGRVAATNGAEIAWNQLKQTIGQSSIEDPINIYLSQGTTANPIWVHDNYLEGYSSPVLSTYSGNGVIADGDSTGDTAYILLQANAMVHTSGGGVAIANGHDVTAQDNRIVSCGKDVLGNTYTQDGVSAITLWNYYKAAGFFNNKITTTAGGMVSLNKTGQFVASDISAITIDATDTITNNNFTDPCLTQGALNFTAEDDERAYWANKLLMNSISLGDQH